MILFKSLFMCVLLFTIARCFSSALKVERREAGDIITYAHQLDDPPGDCNIVSANAIDNNRSSCKCDRKPERKTFLMDVKNVAHCIQRYQSSIPYRINKLIVRVA